METGKKESIFNKFSLSSKVAIVTGGAGLLGKQFTLTLAQAGAHVIVADQNIELAQNQADAINQEGFSSSAVSVDVTDPISVEELVIKVVKGYSRLDVLVNSAALDPKFDPQHSNEQSNNAFENYPLNAWQDSLNVNLTGMFLTSQATVRQMLKQGEGVIINICSIYGLVGPNQDIYCIPGRPEKFKPVDYSVTKAGVLGFTRYLAAYLSGKNIRVNALSPGGVNNDHEKEFVKNYSAHTILGRMSKLDEMNGALLFLASDASSYMTGSNLIIDGGWTAW
ncbi:MAG: SDR family oxidoreductase [Anaerolineaceae bacterium]|nr:SDR family oxidoreductase [Anaerolineaceae bacterium]